MLTLTNQTENHKKICKSVSEHNQNMNTSHSDFILDI